jgi:hypothetical protein
MDERGRSDGPVEQSVASFDKSARISLSEVVVAQPAGVTASRGSGPVSTATQDPLRLPSQMIIRTGQVSVEVDSLEKAIAQVTDLAIKAGGYVANSSISSGANSARTATIEVKLPSDRYSGTLDGMKQIGLVRSAATTTQDVGEEFVDVSARMSNARRLEERLISVLANKTGKLQDILEVERELARVREEIERYEGRIRYLKAQVSMSTLVVTVFEPGPIVGAPGENVLVAALETAWRNCVAVIAGAIAMAGGVLPILVLAALGFLILRPWLRRVRPQPPVA